MLNLKKTAVAVLAFGSSAVFAGTMGPVCTPGNVTVPCESTAWDFGAQALYLKPSFAGAPYIGSTVNATSTNVSYERPNHDWGWGFQVEGSYHYGTGSDVNLNWYHWNRSDSRSLGATFVDLDAGAYGTNVRSNFKPRWDAVNLEFGQHVDFGDMTDLRFHAGAQYAYIKTTNTTTSTTAGVLGDVANRSQTVKFNGFGPRFGFEPSVAWDNGFSVYGKTAVSMLVGDSKFNTSSTTFTPVTTTRNGSTTVIVPELEGKLGIKYNFAMAQGDLGIDLGWMWQNYFNALNVAGGTLTSVDHHTTDFGIEGPYIGLKWVGNVA